MATTVDEGFRVFHGRLTPTQTEVDAASSHRASVEAKLNSSFGVTNFFQSGSYGNGTSVRKYSDVDYFASIPSATSDKTIRPCLTWFEMRSRSDSRTHRSRFGHPLWSASSEAMGRRPTRSSQLTTRTRKTEKMCTRSLMAVVAGFTLHHASIPNTSQTRMLGSVASSSRSSASLKP